MTSFFSTGSGPDSLSTGSGPAAPCSSSFSSTTAGFSTDVPGWNAILPNLARLGTGSAECMNVVCSGRGAAGVVGSLLRVGRKLSRWTTSPLGSISLTRKSVYLDQESAGSLSSRAGCLAGIDLPFLEHARELWRCGVHVFRDAHLGLTLELALRSVGGGSRWIHDRGRVLRRLRGRCRWMWGSGRRGGVKVSGRDRGGRRRELLAFAGRRIWRGHCRLGALPGGSDKWGNLVGMVK